MGCDNHAQARRSGQNVDAALSVEQLLNAHARGGWAPPSGQDGQGTQATNVARQVDSVISGNGDRAKAVNLAIRRGPLAMARRSQRRRQTSRGVESGFRPIQ